ncbi:MAG: preprotein translocase subunit SecE [Deltaproteobacteria bacterium]|nr:preprotein translocase subunit SecE [Deltaproteobacteria bacterium]
MKNNGSDETATPGEKGVGNRPNTDTSARKAASTKSATDKAAQKKKKARLPETGFLENSFTTSVQFLREVKIELKKVTWPSRKETIASTSVVLVVVALVSMYLGFVDFGLTQLVGSVIK